MRIAKCKFSRNDFAFFSSPFSMLSRYSKTLQGMRFPSAQGGPGQERLLTLGIPVILKPFPRVLHGLPNGSPAVAEFRFGAGTAVVPG